MPKKVEKKHVDFEIKTIGEELVFKSKDVSLVLKINDKHIEIEGKNSASFCFRSTNSMETLKRWANVIEALYGAVCFLKTRKMDLEDKPKKAVKKNEQSKKPRSKKGKKNN